MESKQTKLLITDFDGTLVNTFKANFFAYQKAFSEVGLLLTEKDYHKYFGFRFDLFMNKMNVKDKSIQLKIKQLKSQYYPEYFKFLEINNSLLEFIKSFKRSGGYTAIASTATRKNLENALSYIKAKDTFHYILAGEEVNQGKPSPEIYLNVLKHFNVQPDEALVFEDSEVGIQSAQAAGINYIVINSLFYGN